MKQILFPSHLILSMLLLAVPGLVGCGTSNPLSAIILSPAVPVVSKGSSLQLAVTAIFRGGMTVPSWSLVTWSSSDPAVAEVSSKGMVTGLSAGTTVITATDEGHPDISGSVTVSVTELLSISVDPANAVISAGTGTQFTATGLYSASTPTAWSPTWPPDLTSLVSWVSSSTSVALVSMETGSHGFATAIAAGTASITATDLATGITGTATLTVL